jgi:hypothetical protein
LKHWSTISAKESYRQLAAFNCNFNASAKATKKKPALIEVQAGLLFEVPTGFLAHAADLFCAELEDPLFFPATTFDFSLSVVFFAAGSPDLEAESASCFLLLPVIAPFDLPFRLSVT